MIPIFYTQHSECFRLLSAVAAPSCFVRGLCPSLSLSFSRSIFSSFPLFLTNARATTLADNVRSCFLLLFIRTSSATPSTALVVLQSLCRGRLASRHHRPRRLRLWPHIRSSTRAYGPSYHAIAPAPAVHTVELLVVIARMQQCMHQQRDCQRACMHACTAYIHTTMCTYMHTYMPASTQCTDPHTCPRTQAQCN